MRNASWNDSDPLIHAFAARRPTAVRREACPEPEELYEAAAGRLAEPHRLAIVDHVGGCSDCATAWRLAGALQQAPAAAHRYRLPVAVGGLAAAACVTVAIGIMLLSWDSVRPPPSATPAYRGDGDATLPESQLQRNALPREAFRLRWSEGPPDATYTLRISRTDLDPVWVEQALTQPGFLLPPAALEGLPSGTRLLWQVEMQLPDGTRSTSPTYSVVLE